MVFKLFGKDVNASESVKKVGHEAGKTGKALKHMASTAGGAFAGISLAGLGQNLAHFAGETVNKLNEVVKESRAVQRTIGGTIEEASGLRSAAHLTGVSVDAMGAGLRRMSAFAAKNADQLKKMGVATRNADGSAKSGNEVFLQLSDVFAKMPDGIDKTALMLKVFGRNGMAMAPLLNKGSEAIKKFGEEGVKVSDADVKASMEATKAKRQLAEAVEKVQVEIAKNLTPYVTKFAQILKDKVVPMVGKLTDFLTRNKDTIKPIAAVIATLVAGLYTFVKVTKLITAVTKAWTVVQGIFNAVMALNPVALAVIAIAALIAIIVIAYKKSETFRNIVQGAMHGVGKAFGAIKTAAKAVFDWLKPAFAFIGKLFVGYINSWIGGINGIFKLLNKIPHMKFKGHDVGFNLGMIPLLGQPSIGASVNTDYQRTHHDFAVARPGGMTVNVNVAGNVIHEKALARSVRDEMAQMMRRRGLSPASIGA